MDVLTYPLEKWRNDTNGCNWRFVTNKILRIGAKYSECSIFNLIPIFSVEESTSSSQFINLSL